MKLLLGCGEERREGWTRVDVCAGVEPDIVLDLEVRPWPFDSGSAEAIEALDVLEHLADTVGFMDECWRVLSPGGTLKVRVPDWQSANAWGDPTHKRAFCAQTFSYFDVRSDWWHRYGRLYTSRGWKLLSSWCDGNITAELTPVKG
jgi:SAM-dependent methyltransferase